MRIRLNGKKYHFITVYWYDGGFEHRCVMYVNEMEEFRNGSFTFAHVRPYCYIHINGKTNEVAYSTDTTEWSVTHYREPSEEEIRELYKHFKYDTK